MTSKSARECERLRKIILKGMYLMIVMVSTADVDRHTYLFRVMFPPHKSKIVNENHITQN